MAIRITRIPALIRITSAVLTLALTGFTNTAAAQTNYPEQQIRILVPFSPGGSTDLLARGLAKHLSEVWKQPVIVENRPGAGGILALNAAAKARGDGYTLVVHSDGYSIAPAIYSKLPYDVERDFTPVALLARAANAVLVSASSPYKSLQELIDAGNVPHKLSFATAGVGSAQHMQAATISAMAHIQDPVHVPFKGTPEALNDVIAGRVDFIFAPLSTAMPMIIAGKLRPLAISTAERSDLLKDVPTVAEAGVPGFAEQQWWGLFAPSKVPAAVLQKLEAETAVALKTPSMLKLIDSLSSTPGDLVGKDFAKLVDTSIASNKAAAKAYNIHVN
jgi:tripartite-type tricarboxylate transporter receptor subunit TctC